MNDVRMQASPGGREELARAAASPDLRTNRCLSAFSPASAPRTASYIMVRLLLLNA